MKFMIFCFVVLAPSLNSFAQDPKLLYAADNTNLRNFYLTDDGFTIVTEAQKGTSPIKVFLMNEENLIIDTLSKPIYFKEIHPLSDGRIVVEGTSFVAVWEIIDDKIIVKRYISKCTAEFGVYNILFHNWVFMVNRNYTKKKSLISVGVLGDEPGSTDCITKDKFKKIIQNQPSVDISDKLVYSLPITFGVGLFTLGVFMRDAQALMIVDKSGAYKLLKLPLGKSFLWSYSFDWVTETHYLIKTYQDHFELFKLINLELIYVQEIYQHPKHIVGHKIIFCTGNFKKNCDYYSLGIKMENHPVSEHVTLIQEGVVDLR